MGSNSSCAIQRKKACSIPAIPKHDEKFSPVDPNNAIETVAKPADVLYRSIVLDYEIKIQRLRDEDQIFIGGALGNFSLAGFEMILQRHVSHYIINYYLPSSLFVVVSWVSFLVPSDVIPGKRSIYFLTRTFCSPFFIGY